MSGPYPPTKKRLVILSNRSAAAVFVLCAIVTVVLAFVARRAGPFPGDLFIARQIQSLHSPVLDPIMESISRIGFLVPSVILVCAAALGFGITRRYVEAVLILLTATGDLLNDIVKSLVERPRPPSDVLKVYEHLNQYSFPSAHVTHYVVFYGFLFFLFWTLLLSSWLRSLALAVTGALVILIGPSRIYLGAHWPSDVLGGYLLGGLLLVILIETYLAFKARQQLRLRRQRMNGDG